MIPHTRKTLFLSLLCLQFLFSCSPLSAHPLADYRTIVKRVVDGDTIIVRYRGKTERVRLIGVDTPETVHPNKPVEYFGKEASAFTKKLLPAGTRVRLEFDWQPRDKYGRLLAYVYVGTTFVNAEIVRRGYGHAYTRFPFKYLEGFRHYEWEARESGRGMWAGGQAKKEPVPVRHGKIVDNKRSMVYHPSADRSAVSLSQAIQGKRRAVRE